MADPSASAIALCQRFYAALDKSDLDGVVSVFAPHAVLEIGAGESAHAVAYSGIVRGAAAIRDYYRGRLERGTHAAAPLRPQCGFVKQPFVFLPWVVFTGDIHDTLSDSTSLYQGKYLHVWTLDAQAKHVEVMGMFLDPAGVKVPPTA